MNGFVEDMGDPFGGMLGGFGGLFGGGFHRTGSNSSMGSRHQKVEDSIYPLRLVAWNMPNHCKNVLASCGYNSVDVFCHIL